MERGPNRRTHRGRGRRFVAPRAGLLAFLGAVVLALCTVGSASIVGPVSSAAVAREAGPPRVSNILGGEGGPQGGGGQQMIPGYGYCGQMTMMNGPGVTSPCPANNGAGANYYWYGGGGVPITFYNASSGAVFNPCSVAYSSYYPIRGCPVGTPGYGNGASNPGAFTPSAVQSFMNSIGAGYVNGDPIITYGTMLWTASQQYGIPMDVMLAIIGEECAGFWPGPTMCGSNDIMQDLVGGSILTCNSYGPDGGSQTPNNFAVVESEYFELPYCSQSWTQWMSIASGASYLNYLSNRAGSPYGLVGFGGGGGIADLAYGFGSLQIPSAPNCARYGFQNTWGSLNFGICMVNILIINYALAYNAALTYTTPWGAPAGEMYGATITCAGCIAYEPPAITSCESTVEYPSAPDVPVIPAGQGLFIYAVPLFGADNYIAETWFAYAYDVYTGDFVPFGGDWTFSFPDNPYLSNGVITAYLTPSDSSGGGGPPPIEDGDNTDPPATDPYMLYVSVQYEDAAGQWSSPVGCWY